MAGPISTSDDAPRRIVINGTATLVTLAKSQAVVDEPPEPTCYDDGETWRHGRFTEQE
jgi:hypothetical protein